MRVRVFYHDKCFDGACSASLFTRFYRAKNDTTARTHGTGLGLYLTKYFVEAHQGFVTVESEPGKGSLFKICLPMDLTELTQPGLKALVGAKNSKSKVTTKEKAHV